MLFWLLWLLSMIANVPRLGYRGWWPLELRQKNSRLEKQIRKPATYGTAAKWAL